MSGDVNCALLFGEVRYTSPKINSEKKNDINAPRGTVIELEYDILFDRFSGLEQIMFCFKSARQKSNPLA